MRFDILTIFPDIFDSYLNESILKRARERRIIAVAAHDLRDFTENRHTKARPPRKPWRFGRVDDTPYGGGAGMVLQIQPIYHGVEFVKSKIKFQKSKIRTILFSTRGKKLDAKAVQRLSKYDQLILICGRYEGVDERVAKYIADEEISIGEYVLCGGELAAMVLIETVSRFIPGFLGKHESLEEIKGSYPVYTRPESFSPDPKKNKKWAVPKVLLSGNHMKIEKWRRRT